jgi:hypothetical protein
MNSTVMLVIAYLRIGPVTLDRFYVRCRTQRDTLALQVGGWAWGENGLKIGQDSVEEKTVR